MASSEPLLNDNNRNDDDGDDSPLRAARTEEGVQQQQQLPHPDTMVVIEEEDGNRPRHQQQESNERTALLEDHGEEVGSPEDHGSSEQDDGSVSVSAAASQQEQWDDSLKFTRFQWTSIILLTATVWGSGIIFGLYMICHYLFAVGPGWNVMLPHLYSRDRPIATVGIGTHFLGGAITIILGAIQLVAPIRKRFPMFHRWTGRVYITCSTMTAVGGLLFIWTGHGCIGGPTMDIAFSLCAVLTLISSAQAYRHAAITQRYDQHKLWAWRLYSLMISSWMYRMEYGVAAILRLPHDYDHYSYALDYVMDFFFYVPNLLVVEFFWRFQPQAPLFWNVLAVAMLVVAATILLMTLVECMEIWIPGITGKLGDDDDL